MSFKLLLPNHYTSKRTNAIELEQALENYYCLQPGYFRHPQRCDKSFDRTLDSYIHGRMEQIIVTSCSSGKFFPQSSLNTIGNCSHFLLVDRCLCYCSGIRQLHHRSGCRCLRTSTSYSDMRGHMHCFEYMVCSSKIVWIFPRISSSRWTRSCRKRKHHDHGRGRHLLPT